MKVLSLDEALDADIFWYESMCAYDSEYGRVSGINGSSVAITRLGHGGWAYEDLRNYGVDWRCWDRKPEDSERKAVPWNPLPEEG